MSSFNSDATCVAVSTPIPRLFNVEPFGAFYEGSEPASLFRVLLSTSLVAVVPVSAPTTLQLHHTKRKVQICDLSFPRPVMDVRSNRQRLVVVVAKEVYIYDLGRVQLLKTLKIDKDNVPFGLGERWLVLPLGRVIHDWDYRELEVGEDKEGSKEGEDGKEGKEGKDGSSSKGSRKGWVVVYDSIELCPKAIFRAHRSALARICVYRDRIATASGKGTVLRVFQLNGRILSTQELRRGRTPARIVSVAFNSDASVVACASETTVHLFRLGEKGRAYCSIHTRAQEVAFCGERLLVVDKGGNLGVYEKGACVGMYKLAEQ